MNLQRNHIFFGFGGLALIWVSWLIADSMAHPNVKIPLENRQNFVSADILLDLTASVGGNSVVQDEKQLVAENLIPRLGPGDEAMGFSIDTKFTDASCIFGKSDQLPAPPIDAQKMLKTLQQNRVTSQRGVVSDDVYDLATALQALQPKVQSVRDDWSRQAKAWTPPGGQGSDYLGTIAAIRRRYEANPQTNRERWLIIVGDLIDQSFYARTPDVAPSGGEAFGNVKIVLIHPEDAARNWGDITGFWKKYFKASDVQVYSLSEALHKSILPPSPTAGMEMHSGISVPMLFLTLLVVEAVVFAGGYALLRLRKRASVPR
ncbi:MAG TPA: hypothetical protein VKU00_08490, partial [Chthonomonadaceae bacterium]|nr:hypothetical protein [Chthonomonadaceae bacterium]